MWVFYAHLRLTHFWAPTRLFGNPFYRAHYSKATLRDVTMMTLGYCMACFCMVFSRPMLGHARLLHKFVVLYTSQLYSSIDFGSWSCKSDLQGSPTRPLTICGIMQSEHLSHIKNAIVNHLLTNSLLNPAQHGFLPDKSTLRNLTETHLCSVCFKFRCSCRCSNARPIESIKYCTAFPCLKTRKLSHGSLPLTV